MSQKSRVLVIDDDEDVVVLLCHHLSAAGYEVMHALGGIEGLALAAGKLPDIVISDVLMPEFDGFGVLAALRANAPTCTMPVVFLTVLDDTQSKARATRLGVDAYLTKPVQRGLLLETVAARLRRSRKRRSELDEFGIDPRAVMVSSDSLLMRDLASQRPVQVFPLPPAR